ncbi:MAG: DUF2520 domain-containing protein [Planctomycetes bacterium]|nr:DUF2520 domain-containing protein [Planctomycetota bacterium]MCB9918473.1 DUF2520 domain-containing protein [Planctomycetota bacterium]
MGGTTNPQSGGERDSAGGAYSVAILGAGRVASAFASALATTPDDNAGPAKRRLRWIGCWARREVQALSACGRALRFEELATADIVLLAVSDVAIATLAKRLSSLDLKGVKVVAHVSGAHDCSVLAALEGRGPALARMHPLASVPAVAGSAEFLVDAPCVLSGDPAAKVPLTALANSLGMRPTWVGSLDSSLYHAAAALASNGVTALVDVAARMFAAASDDRLGLDVARSLASSACQGLARATPEAALTGPVRRGEFAVVRRHLDALRGSSFEPLYVAVMTAALEVAIRGGLENAAAARIRTLLAGEVRDDDSDNDSDSVGDSDGAAR